MRKRVVQPNLKRAATRASAKMRPEKQPCQVVCKVLTTHFKARFLTTRVAKIHNANQSRTLRQKKTTRIKTDPARRAKNSSLITKKKRMNSTSRRRKDLRSFRSPAMWVRRASRTNLRLINLKSAFPHAGPKVLLG